jgi:hypothetical protein
MVVFLLWPVMIITEIARRSLEAILNLGCAVIVMFGVYALALWVASLDLQLTHNLHPVVGEIIRRIQSMCQWATKYTIEVKRD